LLRPITGANEVALVVCYEIGEDHDPPGRSGLGHLVEHLYVTAPAGETRGRSAKAFFAKYPSGANAQTGDRFTLLAAVFPKDQLEAELRDAAARMGALQINEGLLDRERQRVLQEVGNMFGNIPGLAARNHARALVRPPSRGGRKGGLPADLQAISRDDVNRHWADYYKPRNAILVLAGAIQPIEARRLVAEHFGRLPAGNAPPVPSEPGRPKPAAIGAVSVKTDVPNARSELCIAFAAPEPGTRPYPAFLVLAARLGAASANRPNAPNRPAMIFPLLDDPAALFITAPLDEGEPVDKAVARLDSFVKETIERKLTPADLARTRQFYGSLLGTSAISDLFLARNPYTTAFSLARREQLGLDAVQLDRAWSALTDGDLRAASDEVFAPSRRAAVAVKVAR
jgi:zinc protease